MYVRWQYLGPSWKTLEGRGRSRRLADKQPVEEQCRYVLTVVEGHRDATTHKPRVRVVQYLGVVDELALNPYVVGWPAAKRTRNALVAKLAERLGQAVSRGAMSEDQRTALRSAINAAFPKIDPPEGRSYVVVPAGVRQKALGRWERDVRAAFDRLQVRELEEFMLGMMRKTIRERKPDPAASQQRDSEEERHRESLRQVRAGMAVFGKAAKEAFWKFCAEHDVPTERRDAVWAER
jgi:hypothetical protein